MTDRREPDRGVSWEGGSPDASPEDHTWPLRTRVYECPMLAPSIWDEFTPREDDIIVATAYKAGTTWMQQIVAMLVFQGADLSANLHEISPWVELRTDPREEKLNRLRQQMHRRFVKTHLPLDGISFFPGCKYVYVGRDGRDVFMSLYNHYCNLRPERIAAINDAPRDGGEVLPPCPESPRAMWQTWISRGSFPWEKDGYPWWSLFHNVQSWWNYHHLSNILMVHFADLKKDLAGQIRRIAGFLGIAIDEERFPTIVEKCTFGYMKQNAAQLTPNGGAIFRGGAASFINKGTNGRWREALTDEDLAQYDAAVAERLTPACARWLATGELPARP